MLGDRHGLSQPWPPYWGWLGVERCQLCLQDTSHSAKWHPQAAVGHWVSLCLWSVVGWLIVYQDDNYLYPGQYSQTICRLLWGGNILMARHSWKAGPGEVMTVENLFIEPDHRRTYIQWLCTQFSMSSRCFFSSSRIKAVNHQIFCLLSFRRRAFFDCCFWGVEDYVVCQKMCPILYGRSQAQPLKQ